MFYNFLFLFHLNKQSKIYQDEFESYLEIWHECITMVLILFWSLPQKCMGTHLHRILKFDTKMILDGLESYFEIWYECITMFLILFWNVPQERIRMAWILFWNSTIIDQDGLVSYSEMSPFLKQKSLILVSCVKLRSSLDINKDVSSWSRRGVRRSSVVVPPHVDVSSVESLVDDRRTWGTSVRLQVTCGHLPSLNRSHRERVSGVFVMLVNKEMKDSEQLDLQLYSFIWFFLTVFIIKN